MCGVSEEIQTVLPEFLPKGLHIIHAFPELQPEILPVVFYPGVDQFMEEDKIDQPIGEPGEFLVEADIVVHRAAPPAGLLIAYGNPVEGKTVFPRKPVDTLPEEGLSMFPGQRSSGHGELSVVGAEEARLPAVGRYPGRFFTEEHLRLADGPVGREGKTRLARGFYGDGHAPCPPAPAQVDMTDAGNMDRCRCFHPVIQ